LKGHSPLYLRTVCCLHSPSSIKFSGKIYNA